MSTNWKYYNHALIWQGSGTPSVHQAKMAIRESHAIFARWTYDHDCPNPTQWWYCIKDTFTPIEQLTAKQRYRVRKGLQLNSIVHLTPNQIPSHASEIFQIALDSFSDYPKKYRPNIQQNTFINDILQHDNLDFWLCYDNETQTPCGFGYCTRQDNTVNLTQIKVPTKWLCNEVNAALAYTITEFYLKNNNTLKIVDGERNIKHETQYQNFLVHVLQFKYSYCRLQIVYSPIIAIGVKILFPVRSLIKLIGKKSPFIYNIYCLLYQEEIHKSFNN